MYGSEPKNDQIFLWMILKIIKNLKKMKGLKNLLMLLLLSPFIIRSFFK
jgi:hypothetical protein